MRRKWGRGFQFTFLRNGSLPKSLPRRWGKGFVLFRNGSPSRSTPRKWGKRRRITMPGSISSSRSIHTPAKRWASQKPPRKIKRKNLWLIAVLLMLFLVIQGTIFLDRELRQPLMFLAKIRVNQLATEAINAAIKSEIAQTANSDQMIRWRSDAGGKVTGFEIDYKQQMAITAKTIDVVNRVLKQHEDVPERIPVGHALNSPFISSIGPSVSVKFHPASVVKVDVETESSEAGINMLLVEVFVRIRTEIAVVIPFDKEPEVLETKIPLSYALVVGDVPTYYYDNNGNPVGSGAGQAPSIALPTPSTSIEKPAT
ncbi:sporulation protein YunB [Cohnella herbarum]|uniref:Sporulation protein YunB n=1 Tax=Cohnella herbarum TaxID=2728023 RepID=A0A7Z2VJI3_9BACL|nr:sporulation protein YunB [Cohnella herbarum]QJD84204.1 sporulation protein YunB [Cohnella herbarum]